MTRKAFQKQDATHDGAVMQEAEHAAMPEQAEKMDPAAAQRAPAGTPQKRTPRKKREDAPSTSSKSGRKTGPKKKHGGRRKKKTGRTLGLTLALGAVEAAALLIFALMTLMVALGYAAFRLAGTSFLHNRLPFACAALAVIVGAAFFLRAWLRLRVSLSKKNAVLAPLLALALAAGLGYLSSQHYFSRELTHFRLLVGGKSEMRDSTLRHQIFAAYRRLPAADMQTMLTRALIYRADIEDTARVFKLDPDILLGLAAAESSFLPRESADGGKGLFQITRVPEAAQKEVQKRLGTEASVFDLNAPRHNAFLAAATLRHYLTAMHGDMILGLLAYNIGPKNGGLQDIMSRYGATDFVTIQPYLQELPRNYPVRVLAYALAFRIYRVEHRLLSYEEGLNAIRVQHIGIPGL